MNKIIAVLLMNIVFVNSVLAKDENKNSSHFHDRSHADKKVVPSISPKLSNSLDKFKNCKEAIAAGVSNVPVTTGYQPSGWRRSADADNDGIACEKK
jgi:Excalibur calcium-binding domain